jgi:hypothetical protein
LSSALKSLFTLFTLKNSMTKVIAKHNFVALMVAGGLSLPIVSALPASAVTISIGAKDYEVTVFVGKYFDNASLFQVPPAGQMPWWGDSTGDTAAEFAATVFNQLGQGPETGYGPVFAYDFAGINVQGIVQSLTNVAAQLDQAFSANNDILYAVATPLSQGPVTSVPGPLPVVGALGAFTFSRRLRRLVRNRV